MATYEYRCANCGHQFEKVLTIKEHDRARPKCPECKSSKVEQVYSVFFAKTDSKA